MNTKSYAVLPLPPKVTSKGSSAGAESPLEVAKGVNQKLKPGKHIASAGGSPALQEAAGLAKTPSLKGVSHLRFVFTPLATLPKKRYDPRLCDTATQTGARWDGKRKERQFHIGSW